MNPVIKNQWVEALRSDKYKQGRNYLHIGEKYCCLGVLCDLHAKDTNNNWESSTPFFSYFGKTQFLPNEVSIWAEINSALFLQRLVEMNDRGDLFADIADYIEEN